MVEQPLQWVWRASSAKWTGCPTSKSRAKPRTPLVNNSSLCTPTVIGRWHPQRSGFHIQKSHLKVLRFSLSYKRLVSCPGSLLWRRIKATESRNWHWALINSISHHLWPRSRNLQVRHKRHLWSQIVLLSLDAHKIQKPRTVTVLLFKVAGQSLSWSSKMSERGSLACQGTLCPPVRLRRVPFLSPMIHTETT